MTVVVVTGSAFADEKARDIYLTGHEWLIFNETERSMYLIGLKDGMTYAAFQLLSDDAEGYKRYADFYGRCCSFPKGMSTDVIQKGIELILEDPANHNVRVIEALRAFKMRVDGKGQVEIDKYLESARKRAHDAAEKRDATKQ
jgi:hypothetical protein